MHLIKVSYIERMFQICFGNPLACNTPQLVKFCSNRCENRLESPGVSMTGPLWLVMGNNSSGVDFFVRFENPVWNISSRKGNNKCPWMSIDFQNSYRFEAMFLLY
jgi:hypothetical protein